MVCVSGGRDSHGVLEILIGLHLTAPIMFELVTVNLDRNQPGFSETVLPEYLSTLGIQFFIYEKDTYSLLIKKLPESHTYYNLCSRLSRGNLYGFAQKIGLTKIDLGHHREDIVESQILKPSPNFGNTQSFTVIFAVFKMAWSERFSRICCSPGRGFTQVGQKIFSKA
tara:strand:- start:26 stop:529 length:504 start_codon:yes stop_codon:yes gene_type:complete